MSLINFSGLASGIDTNALIDAMSKATRAQKVDPLNKRITELTDTDDALEKLRTMFNDLKDSLYGFSTLAGGGVAKTATSTNESYVSASASNAATPGAYNLNVTALARNGVYTSPAFASSSSLVGAAPATQTVVIGEGSDAKTISVEITASSTISQYVSQFNEQAAANGNCAQASIIMVGSGDYRVMISSTNTGTAKGSLDVSGLSGTLAGGDSQTATDASFTINSMTDPIIRSDNSVSDVISGVTFNLQGIGAATVTVTDDAKSTGVKIQDWVDKYNEIVTYMSENNKISRDESGNEVENIWGVLASTSTDDSALSSLRTAFSSISSAISGTGVNILADLGITTQRDGTLKFDKTQFESAMSTSSASVNSILTQLADTTATTGGTIDLITRFNGSFDITINSNKSLIEDMANRVNDAENAIAQQEESLRARFARLESMMSKMQSQQSALSYALAGLSSK